jgi:hypothetical protein
MCPLTGSHASHYDVDSHPDDLGVSSMDPNADSSEISRRIALSTLSGVTETVKTWGGRSKIVEKTSDSSR